MTRKFWYRLMEMGTAMLALLGAYGQREAWVADDGWQFVTASVVLWVGYVTHRMTITTPPTSGEEGR